MSGRLDDAVQSLSDRLDALEAENARLVAEVETLRESKGAASDAGTHATHEAEVSRRGLLKSLGGAAAAGAVAAGAGSLLLPRAAGATNGAPVNLGVVN